MPRSVSPSTPAPFHPRAPGRKVLVLDLGIGTLLASPEFPNGHRPAEVKDHAYVQVAGHVRRLPLYDLTPLVSRAEVPEAIDLPRTVQPALQHDPDLQPIAGEDLFALPTLEKVRAKYLARPPPRTVGTITEPERVRLTAAIEASHFTDIAIAERRGIGEATVHRARHGGTTRRWIADEIHGAIADLEREKAPRTQSVSEARAAVLQTHVEALRAQGWSYMSIAHACACSMDVIRLLHHSGLRPGWDLAQQIEGGCRSLMQASRPLPPLQFTPNHLALLRGRLNALPIADGDTLNTAFSRAVWEVVAGAHAAGHGPLGFEATGRLGHPQLGAARRMIEDLTTLPDAPTSPDWNPPPGRFPLWKPDPRHLSFADLARLRAEIRASGYTGNRIGAHVDLDGHTVAGIAAGSNTTPATAKRIRRALRELPNLGASREVSVPDAKRLEIVAAVDPVHRLGWSYDAIGAVCQVSGSFIFRVLHKSEGMTIESAASIETGIAALARLSEGLPSTIVAELPKRLDALVALGIGPAQWLPDPLARALVEVVSVARGLGVDVAPRRLQTPGTRAKLGDAIALVRELRRSGVLRRVALQPQSFDG